jgi:3-hydroxyacyl-CoA dehydrogenase
MFHADTVGLANVLATIKRFQSGYQGGTWTPSALLVKLAAEGKTFN